MKPLNFSEVIPYTVANWIESNNNGDSYNYNKGKEDTMTVIGRLERLPVDLFNRYDRLKSWFLKNLEMREAKSGSLYRAFLSLRNDKNINLRVADHYSTENSTIRAAELFGSSDYEYHLNVLNDDKGGKRGEIRNGRLVEYEEISVDVIVATIWLDEFVVDGDENCNKALDDLIFLLKYGRINNDTNESLSNLSYIVGFEQFEKYKNNTMIHIKRIDEMVNSFNIKTNRFGKKPQQTDVVADKEMVESFIKQKFGNDCLPLDWLNEHYFSDNHGCSGSVCVDENDAYNRVLNGEEHQNAVDYVEGAQTDDEWIDQMLNAGVTRRVAESIIKNKKWDKLVELILEKNGPQYFLSGYSGEVYQLDDGLLLYY